MTFEVKALTESAVAVLGQLFVHGPTWDGNLITKSGRDALVQAGLAAKTEGWNFLTAEGVLVAASWKPASLSARYLRQCWERKAARS